MFKMDNKSNEVDDFRLQLVKCLNYLTKYDQNGNEDFDYESRRHVQWKTTLINIDNYCRNNCSNCEQLILCGLIQFLLIGTQDEQLALSSIRVLKTIFDICNPMLPNIKSTLPELVTTLVG